MSTNINIICILLTYGNRGSVLQKVVNAILSQHVEKIIIVDNNSSAAAKNVIQEIYNSNSTRIQIIHNKKNIGTARALTAAMQKAIEDQSFQFISILDDDNLICENYFDKIKSFWVENKLDEHKEKVLLSGFRINKNTYTRAVIYNQNWVGVADENNYWGFHIKNIFKIGFNRIKPKVNFKAENYEPVKINNSAWGGMFFHKNLIHKIGLPNTDYHIFLDDYEYSVRLAKAGGNIFLLPQCIITDIDEPTSEKYSRFTNLVKFENPSRVYFAARNHFVFERKYRCINPIIFYINVLSFIKIVSWFSIFNFNFTNFRTIVTAVYDGIKNNLGENKNFPLDFE